MAEQFFLLRLWQRIHGSFDFMEGGHVERLALPGMRLQALYFVRMGIANLIVSILGFGGAIAALVFGLRQYKRAEQWKRGEFVAEEIKEFESNPSVRNAMVMIDWGVRTLNLFLIPNPTTADYIRVTREDQWRALVPHPLKPKYPSLVLELELEGDSPADPPRMFTIEEARIRDSYDAFLDSLERFANFAKSGLVSPEEFRPYLAYWIDSIANVDDVQEYKGDAEWRCALLTFINYYKYSGVSFLLSSYGWDIEPGGPIYEKLKKLMQNKQLYQDLVETLTEKNAA